MNNLVNITIKFSTTIIQGKSQDLNYCSRCEDLIIGKYYQVVSIVSFGNEVEVTEHKGIELCPSCYNEVKHKFD